MTDENPEIVVAERPIERSQLARLIQDPEIREAMRAIIFRLIGHGEEL